MDGPTQKEFQPTLPVRGATNSGVVGDGQYVIFQPTLPVRGATTATSLPCGSYLFQPTLPVRGATRLEDMHRRFVIISTHAPRAGSDRKRSDRHDLRRAHFNPRSPCGERLRRRSHARPVCHHFNPSSPCGERPCRAGTATVTLDFNPRSPCGERPRAPDRPCRWPADFNPRSPCGERPE